MNMHDEIDLINSEIAQSWFADSDKREVSTKYDKRETSVPKLLIIPMILTYYRNTFNKMPVNILDVGCGDGELLNHISHINSNVNLYGIDPSDEVINKAQINVPSGRFHRVSAEDINNINLPKMDIIITYLSFGLWRNKIKGLKNMIDLLSPQSMLYIIDLNADSYTDAIKTTNSIKEEEYIKEQYNSSLSEEEFKSLLTEQIELDKFEVIVKVSSLGFSPLSDEYFSAINNPYVLKCLTSFNSNMTYNKNSPIINLNHGWLIKNQTLDNPK